MAWAPDSIDRSGVAARLARLRGRAGLVSRTTPPPPSEMMVPKATVVQKQSPFVAVAQPKRKGPYRVPRHVARCSNCVHWGSQCDPAKGSASHNCQRWWHKPEFSHVKWSDFYYEHEKSYEEAVAELEARRVRPRKRRIVLEGGRSKAELGGLFG